MRCTHCGGTGEVPDPPLLQAHGHYWPRELEEIRVRLDELQAPEDLYDPAYWRSIDAWLARHPRIGYLDEAAKYLAWWRSQTGPKRHKRLKAGLRNWLATAERWDEREEQRRAQQQQRYDSEHPGSRRRP